MGVTPWKKFMVGGLLAVILKTRMMVSYEFGFLTDVIIGMHLYCMGNITMNIIDSRALIAIQHHFLPLLKC